MRAINVRDYVPTSLELSGVARSLLSQRETSGCTEDRNANSAIGGGFLEGDSWSVQSRWFPFIWKPEGSEAWITRCETSRSSPFPFVLPKLRLLLSGSAEVHAQQWDNG